jgi:hypothetical protein
MDKNQNSIQVYMYRGQDSDWLWARVGVPSPERVKNFLHTIQIISGVHPTSYPMGTGGVFPGVKRPWHEADHSPPARAKVKKMSI